MAENLRNITRRLERPPSRQWMGAKELDSNVNSQFGMFNILSSNVLSERYTTGEPVQGYDGQFFQAGEILNKDKYGHCPEAYLEWGYRKQLSIREILAINPDVACLQEVEKKQFDTFFSKKLSKLGYKGVFCARSSGNGKPKRDEISRIDGCAIFYKADKLTLVDTTRIDFNAYLRNKLENDDATSTGTEQEDKSNENKNTFAFEKFRLMTAKGCVALCAMFRTTYSFWPEEDVPEVDQGRHRHLLVCNAHLESNATMPDVRIVQAMVLVKKAQEIMKDFSDSQLIICGDFNALPQSGCLKYLREGRISLQDPDFKSMPYGEVLSKMFGSPNEEGHYTHDLGLASAISSDVMPFSCFQPKFKGMIDYILFEKDKIQLLESLKGPVDERWLEQNSIVGAPCQHLPSDHFPLATKLRMKEYVHKEPSIEVDMIQETSETIDAEEAIIEDDMIQETLEKTDAVQTIEKAPSSNAEEINL